eukprot:12758592-Alexandrium_andersonii.AAC.1
MAASSSSMAASSVGRGGVPGGGALQFEAQPNFYIKALPNQTHPVITIELPGVGMARALVAPGWAAASPWATTP